MSGIWLYHETAALHLLFIRHGLQRLENMLVQPIRQNTHAILRTDPVHGLRLIRLWHDLAHVGVSPLETLGGEFPAGGRTLPS